uniref:F-box protein 30b n=1 Tax=Sinocyclocheilus rhinocerous TaxID=307959 RepID=A0A673I2T3_9TELE
MEEPHIHCMSCISRRCMVKPEPGTSCDLISCPLVCGAVFHSCKAIEHKLLCPLERVPCLNQSIGCPFTLARGQMAEHLEVCPAGVVCCTMEWNRWPVNDEDYRSYERLSQEANEVEQLDMALALQDQRTMLASLKLVSLAPTSGSEKKTRAAGQSEKPGLVSIAQPPCVQVESVEMEPTAGCSKDKISNGINGLKEEHYGELYQTTVETTKSLAAALNVLIHLNSSEADCTATNASAALTERNGELHEKVRMREDAAFSCDKIASGVNGLKEELQPQQHQKLMELGRSLASALGALGDAVKGTEPINGSIVNDNGKLIQSETLESADVDMKDVTSAVDGEPGAVGGFDGGETALDVLAHEATGECCPVMLEDIDRQGFCNGSHSIVDDLMESTTEHHQNPVSQGSWEFIGPLIPHRPEIRHDQHAFLIQEASGSQAPLLQQPIHAQTLSWAPREGSMFTFECGQLFRREEFVSHFRNVHGDIHSGLNGWMEHQFKGLDLYWVSDWAPREGSMFTFECGQLFRREEFVSHFRNVHGDIHSGLNGWMEHRCPLAYYGCTYSQRRFCPSTQGSKVVHDRHLRSFGVQPISEPVTEPKCDHLSGLPFEVLQHVARFLDGFSLCQLSMVSRTMRDVCASLLQTRGMVVVQWEKKHYLDGRRTWQIKDKVWRFSTAFSPVNRWEFADISSMADHLKRCPYNEVLRQVEAVPLPCMCTTRELTRDGRSLRSVLKPVS